jgi:hypothetical protein
MKAASRNLSLRNVLLFIWPLADAVRAHQSESALSLYPYVARLTGEDTKSAPRKASRTRRNFPLISTKVKRVPVFDEPEPFGFMWCRKFSRALF